MQEVFEKIDAIFKKYRKKWFEQPNTEPCKGLECKGKDCIDCILIHLENDINQVAEEYEDFCEWFKYDYRTIAPKNHDIGNPYWRIPEDIGKLMFCPYCGKKIKVVE